MLVGETGVGKTSLCHRFLYGNFLSHQGESITMNNTEKVYRKGNESVTVKYQDTHGFEACGSHLPPSLCRGTDVILMVYALDEDDSIKTLYALMEGILRSMPYARKILVGNKYDLREANRGIESLISGSRDLTEADNKIKVSAYTGQGIQELEGMIIQLVHKPKPDYSLNSSMKLNDMQSDPLHTNTSCCKVI